MTEISSVKKFIISTFCAFAFILYVPTACIISSSLHGDVDFVNAGERDTGTVLVFEEEESTECEEFLR